MCNVTIFRCFLVLLILALAAPVLAVAQVEPCLTITPENFTAQGVAYKWAIWNKSQTVARETGSTLILTVRFVGGTANDRALVQKIAPEWSKYANVRFVFNQSGASDIRVGFQSNDGNWSAPGLAAKTNDRYRNRSMNLVLAGRPPHMQRRRILHEFGHALGLAHEHRSPTANIRWNEQEVIKAYKNVWPPEKVRRQVLNRLDETQTHFTAFDPASIMLYPIPQKWNYNGFERGWNTQLSEMDKKFIGTLYGQPVPTIHALLLIMDGDLVLGSAAQKSATSIRKLLQDVKGTRLLQLSLTSLNSGSNNSQQQPTPARIQKWFNELSTHENDTIFVYYVGNGEANENRQLFLNLPHGTFYRDELVRSMQRKTARLKILITDADSYGPSVTDSTSVRRFSVPRGSSTNPSKLSYLFRDHTGFLNLTAATEGESAWTDDEKGGFFTHSLVNAIYNAPDLDRDGNPTWTDVFQLTRQGTMDLFNTIRLVPQIKGDLQRKGIKSQRPKHYGPLPSPTIHY